ncbi:MAG: MBL fold metallo-hydrolase [Candidatus Nanoarchaeia archaeon]
MGLSILPLGGFGEVGKNCVAIIVDEEAFICDMGVHLEHYIELTGNDFFNEKHVYRKLVNAGAIPDIKPLQRKQLFIRGIFCSHGHLDHIGAIPFLYNKIKRPVYATPFTAKLIQSFSKDRAVNPEVKAVKTGKKIRLSPKVSVEFIHVAHSIPQSALIAFHTPYGVVVYGNDFKNDQRHPFEKPTDLVAIKSLQGKTKILLLDSLYAQEDKYATSEQDARQLLFDLKNDVSSKRAIVISTFSSQLSRLQSICDFADMLNRKVVFLGRSLTRYIRAAKDVGIVDLTVRGKCFTYARQVKKFLANEDHPQNYVIVVTGHQGEPGAVLDRMSRGQFLFSSQDAVIFSCSVIPSVKIQRQRAQLEQRLEENNVSLFTSIHSSGHGAGKDLDDFVDLIKPEVVIPAHAEPLMEEAFCKRISKLGLSCTKCQKLVLGVQTSFE